MSTVDLHTLTGAYALGALSEQESAEFAGHLAQCQACTQEVRELRETAARLALAVAEVPPAALRTRVMAALPEVRQLPPRGHRAAVVPLRRARRNRLPYLAAAACLVAAALAGGLAVNARNEADRQRDRSARAEQQAAAVSALMAAPDATFHTTALKGGGSGTVVASKRRADRLPLPRPAGAVRSAGVRALVQPQRHHGARRARRDRQLLRHDAADRRPPGRGRGRHHGGTPGRLQPAHHPTAGRPSGVTSGAHRT